MPTKLPLSIPERPPAKRQRGGQFKYDPAKHDAAVELTLSAGATDASAAYDIGINPATYADWYRRGDNGESPFDSFAKSVDKGKARFEASMLYAIRDASNKSWQAAAWILERRFPGRYARTDRVEHSGPDGERLRVTVTYDDVAPLTAATGYVPAQIASPGSAETIDGIVTELLGIDEFGAPIVPPKAVGDLR